MQAVEHKCPECCPGCRIAKESYDKILEQKLAWLKTKLSRFENLITEAEKPENDNRIGYRFRVCLNASHNGTNWEFGLLTRKKFIPLTQCVLQNNYINETLEILRKKLPAPENFKLKYVLQTHRQVVLVVKVKRMPPAGILDEAAKALQSHGIEGFHLHLNPCAGKKVILKSFVDTVFGEYFSLDDTGLTYSPLSFIQLQRSLHLASLDAAYSFFSPQKDDVVIDLFSGIGVSINTWKSRGMRTIGVEIGKDAVACCALNAQGADVIIGKCHQRIPQLEEWLQLNLANGAAFNVYLNPPRSGAGEELLHWFVKIRPEKLAYLSCNPLSLAQELNFLSDNGFEVKRIIPYDFFPYTRHIESLALIKRKK